MFKVNLILKGKITASVAVMLSFFFASNIYAQISGISGAKLLVPDAHTVEQGHFEFEPSFSVFRSDRQFDGNGSFIDLQKSEILSSVSFRITLGITNNLEIGTSFPTGMDDVFFGSKFTVFETKKIALAVIAGGSLSAGNSSTIDSTTDQKSSYGTGIIISHNVNDALSIDGILSYSKINGSDEMNSVVCYGISFGYFLSSALQFVTELNGIKTLNLSSQSQKISITPGFTYQFSKYLLLVFGAQKDIWGENETSGTDYVGAFTMRF